MPKKQEQEQAQSFEESMARIDEIIDALDTGSLGLEETLELFGEGAGLIAHCNKALEAAKLKMEKLLPEEPRGE